MTDQLDARFDGAEANDNKVIRNTPNGTRIVVVSDMQIPLEDAELLEAIFRFAREWKPKGLADYHLFLNGDVMDNFTLSKYPARVQPKFTLADEVKLTRGYLKAWGKPFTHRHFVFGNHEDRWDRELYAANPMLAGFAPRLQDVLQLEKLGYDYVDYLKHYDFEGFVITHGDKTTQHVAAGMIQSYHKSGTSGHTNRPQDFTYRDASGGEPITWYVTGMTCRMDIHRVIKDWRRQQPWQQGFLIGEVHDGVLHVQPIRVHHGGFWAAGKFYAVKAEEEK